MLLLIRAKVEVIRALLASWLLERGVMPSCPISHWRIAEESVYMYPFDHCTTVAPGNKRYKRLFEKSKWSTILFAKQSKTLVSAIADRFAERRAKVPVCAKKKLIGSPCRSSLEPRYPWAILQQRQGACFGQVGILTANHGHFDPPAWMVPCCQPFLAFDMLATHPRDLAVFGRYMADQTAIYIEEKKKNTCVLVDQQISKGNLI